MTALTITHKIAAPLQVIEPELGLAAQNLVTAIRVLDIVDGTTFDAGNAILIKAHDTLKKIEAQRVALKRPINELAKAIEGVCASVADPLEAAKRSMQGKVAAFQKAEQAKADALRREAEERARIEREAAEAERARLQAIADELRRQQVAEATAKAEAEAKELEAILGKPVEAEPVKVAPAPVIEAAPVAAPVAVAAPLPKAAVQTVEVPMLVVRDAGALAAWLFATGRMDLVEFKMREVKTMFDAGVPVPGVAMEKHTQIRMAGR